VGVYRVQFHPAFWIGFKKSLIRKVLVFKEHGPCPDDINNRAKRGFSVPIFLDQVKKQGFFPFKIFLKNALKYA
jgi:hypothetical protein